MEDDDEDIFDSRFWLCIGRVPITRRNLQVENFMFCVFGLSPNQTKQKYLWQKFDVGRVNLQTASPHLSTKIPKPLILLFYEYIDLYNFKNY